MARRMIKDRRTSTAATSWTWFLQHARRRFTTPTGWQIAQAAGRAVFDSRTVTFAASGSIADLERQGLVRRTRRPRRGNLTATVAYRCASFERLREHGFSMAWTFDQLASSANKGLRVYRAQRRGLVTRTPSTVDRRSFQVSITDAGREIVAQVGTRFAERIKDCAAPLTEADRKRLSRLATRLVTEIPKQLVAAGVPQPVVDGFAGGRAVDLTGTGDLGQRILASVPAAQQPQIAPLIPAIAWSRVTMSRTVSGLLTRPDEA